MMVLVEASKPHSFQLLIVVMFFHMFGNLNVTVGSSDTISPARPLYRNETLISAGQKFELGFFSPGISTNSYVGIWYYDIPVQTIIWIANRESPIPQLSNNSRLVLADDGGLRLYSDSNNVVWTTDVSVADKGVILDDGNFVVGDGLRNTWQSFDYPTDTWMPGEKLGIDKGLINKRQILTSWKNPDDPSPGIYAFGLDPSGPELLVWTESQITWRSGLWDGSKFDTMTGALSNFSYVDNRTDKYFSFNTPISITTRYVMTYNGQIRQFLWVEEKWKTFSVQSEEDCTSFAYCGPNGLCRKNSSPICQCFEGFGPRFPEEWRFGDWSGGCIRTKPLQCSNYAFKAIDGISVPLNSQSLKLENPQVCQSTCLRNCTCSAYTYDRGSCLLWTGDLLDSRVLENSQGVLYVRSSEALLANKKQSNVLKAVIITIPLLICIPLAYIFWRIWRKRHNKQETGETNENLLLLKLDISSKQTTESNNITAHSVLGVEEDLKLTQFSFSSISAATNNFSPANKLGEGGFGPVYKGDLVDGHSVAVKRLSKRSGQGLEELRNETVLIAKLQHRNLVRLLGCCMEQEEKILIYEYMPNKSLDCFIFDPCKQTLLDWSIRVRIIEGIGQGLLYLHQHSRLRIVHRDLKASNILLDDEMIPKISDFGMARIFGGNVLQSNTNRIVGTYGYMSPEYAMEGLFSIKSDVFAFGVLLLEILSGKRNTGFRHLDCLSLLGYAWELWKTERVLELIDSNLELPSSFLPLRYVHVGLLCVQESPVDRPTMFEVLAMTSNEHIQMVSPKRPAFTSGGSLDLKIDKAENCSMNKLTASVMDGR